MKFEAYLNLARKYDPNLIPKFDILKISISGYEPIDLEQILEKENEKNTS